jgi:hypothetical protein
VRGLSRTAGPVGAGARGLPGKEPVSPRPWGKSKNKQPAPRAFRIAQTPGYSLSRIALKTCFAESGIVPVGEPVAWRNNSITSARPPAFVHNCCNSVSRAARVFVGSLVIGLVSSSVNGLLVFITGTSEAVKHLVAVCIGCKSKPCLNC